MTYPLKKYVDLKYWFKNINKMFTLNTSLDNNDKNNNKIFNNVTTTMVLLII